VRESIGDNVVLSRDVSDVGRVLCYKVKMIELPRRAFVPFLPEGVGDRSMFCEDDEAAPFQHVVEMLDGLADG
jgi:hypothetical protein